MSRPAVTVLTPVSPIPSHPDTAILDHTIESVRHHLPDAEIMLMFDGIRRQQGERTADYHEFTRRMLWRADKVYGGICPFVFDKHLHHAGAAAANLTTDFGAHQPSVVSDKVDQTPRIVASLLMRFAI